MAFNRAEIDKLYSLQKSSFANKTKKLDIYTKQVIELYDKDFDTNDKLVLRIGNIIKSLDILKKPDSLKNQYKLRTKLIAETQELYQQINDFIGDGATNKTVETILGKLQQIVKQGKINNKNGLEKTLFDSYSGEVSNIVGGLSEYMAGIKVSLIMDSLNLGSKVKFTGEKAGPKANKEAQKLSKDSRDISINIPSDDQVDINIGVSVKEYKVKSKNQINIKARTSSFRQILNYLNTNHYSETLPIDNQLKNDILYDGMINFHNQRFKKEISPAEFFGNLTLFTTMVLTDILYAQGDFINQGVQLIIANRKIYPISKLFPNTVLGLGTLSQKYQSMIGSSKQSFPGEPSFDIGLEEKKYYQYLERYSKMTLVMHHRMQL